MDFLQIATNEPAALKAMPWLPAVSLPMTRRRIVTFDTSAINQLADDRDSEALIAALRCGFDTRLTFTSISEIVANEGADRRRQLLRVCRRLLSTGDCIDPQNEIIRKMVESFEHSAQFDWQEVNVRLPEAEDEIARQENFEDDLARQERDDNRANENEFEQLYRNAKPAFDRLFARGDGTRPSSASELVAWLQIPGGAFWSMARNLYDRVGNQHPDEAAIRRFVAACDPFRSLMIALCAAQYDRCVRPHGMGPSLRTGRNDTFMAVCLPYCDQFVTHDARQLACFHEVVQIAGLDAAVCPYDEFRSGSW